MSKRSYLFGLTLALLYLSGASAQQYPILDKVADKIIQKYQTSSCEQLYQAKAEKKQPSFAGYAAYTDYEIGRVIQNVEDMGKLDNTLIIYISGDNGTSAEGTLVGFQPNDGIQRHSRCP